MIGVLAVATIVIGVASIVFCFASAGTQAAWTSVGVVGILMFVIGAGMILLQGYMNFDTFNPKPALPMGIGLMMVLVATSRHVSRMQKLTEK